MFKLYLVSINGLEDRRLLETAMSLIDGHRQTCVYKYKQEKDRVRAVAAGLLLQAGFLELEFEDGCYIGEQNIVFQSRQDMMSDQGICYRLQAAELIEKLLQVEKLPLPLRYQTGLQGKPFWEKVALEGLKPDKRLWHFNLSHSGDYVALAISDAAVGVDIQQARETSKIAGGYKAFSRMEAYVKCTGEGYIKGIGKYRSMEGNMSGYEIQSLELIEGYAFYLCRKKPVLESRR